MAESEFNEELLKQDEDWVSHYEGFLRFESISYNGFKIYDWEDQALEEKYVRDAGITWQEGKRKFTDRQSDKVYDVMKLYQAKIDHQEKVNKVHDVMELNQEKKENQ